jgi:hypothetical protein
MGIQQEILLILKAHHPEWLADDWHLLQIQEFAYRFQYDEKTLFIKWILGSDLNGLNEIKINQTWLPDSELHTPQLIMVLPSESGYLAAWEWIEGKDLRNQHRELLSQAFAQIGRYHQAHRNRAPVISPISKHEYSSIPEMLKGELALLCADFPDPIPQALLVDFLSIGYATRIHGDLHPGNIHAVGENLFFTDWGYAINSLNLLELEYIQSVEFEPASDPGEWWLIRSEEARVVLPAYFDACGLDGCNVILIHWAVMVWAQLQSHFNSIVNRNPEGSRICRRNIVQLMDIRENWVGTGWSP